MWRLMSHPTCIAVMRIYRRGWIGWVVHHQRRGEWRRSVLPCKCRDRRKGGYGTQCGLFPVSFQRQSKCFHRQLRLILACEIGHVWISVRHLHSRRGSRRPRSPFFEFGHMPVKLIRNSKPKLDAFSRNRQLAQDNRLSHSPFEKMHRSRIRLRGRWATPSHRK